MTKSLRSFAVLALALALTGAMAFADGPGIYKTKCASCHGATGTPNPGMAKLMGIKPAGAMKVSEADIIATIKNGKSKMKPIAGLSDGDVKAVAAYFKTLK